MAVKCYSLKTDGNKYCSAHTKVKEMRSKDGADKILIDTDLMTMIEKLFSKLQCSKYIISSGYRTPSHDKAVGGNGSGQHTKGKAADACFYDKKGKIIPAQIVCCVAQDLGFKGIANISKNYRYVHLDMRTNGTYYGNEVVSYRTVTNDFYKYFGISKSDVVKYIGKEPIEQTKNTAVLLPNSNKIKDKCSEVSTAKNKFPYKVKISADSLNIRKGAGTDSKIVGCITDNGVYTIVEEQSGKGATLWGRLKSGVGWISLDYVKKL